MKHIYEIQIYGEIFTIKSHYLKGFFEFSENQLQIYFLLTRKKSQISKIQK